MKKPLIISAMTAALLLSATMSYADTTNNQSAQQKPACTCNKPKPPQMDNHKKDRPNLDERLKLTEEQKTKAHEIRMQGHEKIKPVMKKMKAKHEEIKQVAQSNITKEEKDKKIATLKKDMQKLKQEARQIRNENTKQFEAILTPEQKAEFEKIKQEAKARHKQMKKHKRGFGPGPDGMHRPPMQPQK